MMNELQNKIKTALRSAMFKSEYAHQMVEENETLAATFAVAALSELTLAESLYFTNHNGEKKELENCFSAMHLFIDELLDNVKLKHSHQHTLLKFQDLKRTYNDLDL